MDRIVLKNKTFYDLLGVPQDATQEEIKQAFRQIARDCHPDVSSEVNIENMAELDLTGTRKFKIITFAYHTLIDPVRREEYDNSLLPGWEPAPKASAPKSETNPTKAAYGVFGTLDGSEEMDWEAEADEHRDFLRPAVRPRRGLIRRICSLIGL